MRHNSTFLSYPLDLVPSSTSISTPPFQRTSNIPFYTLFHTPFNTLFHPPYRIYHPQHHLTSFPESVDRLHDGCYLVDGGELHRLRASLDRARVILDTLLRREKYKLRLCRLEGECFQSQFQRLLDKAKGRKSQRRARSEGDAYEGTLP